jgi:hypothetical protein
MIDIDKMLRDFAREIDWKLVETFGENKVGFALLVFEFGDREGHGGHYISNAQRDDMIKALRETADRLERNEDIGASVGRA